MFFIRHPPQSPRGELVTTNYDVILEGALDILGPDVDGSMDTGWRGTFPPKPSVYWKNYL